MSSPARQATDRDSVLAERRHVMVDDIVAEARETASHIGKSEFAPRVMEAITRVPRHEFAPSMSKALAYENAPLSIGHGQTISQPYIVALMTDLLAVGPQDVVLEIGTGSGYQAAVLAEMVKRVHTLEIVRPLAVAAREVLERLGYDNVEVRRGDGNLGWPDAAPFDGVIVTAAARAIPPQLVEQLKPGGRLVIPVGGELLTQDLLLVEKTEEGEIKQQVILPVAFVPLRGRRGH